MHLEIDTPDKNLLLDLIGKSSFPSAGEAISAPRGVSLVYQGMIRRKGLDFPTTLQFIVEHLDDAVTGLFVAWLYDKLKGRAQTLRGNGHEIQLSLDALKRIFERHENK